MGPWAGSPSRTERASAILNAELGMLKQKLSEDAARGRSQTVKEARSEIDGVAGWVTIDAMG